MVEQNSEYGKGKEASKNRPGLFSIDFAHLSKIIVIDVRSSSAGYSLALLSKFDIIPKEVLLEINEFFARGGQPELNEETSDAYAQSIFRAINAITPLGLGSGYLGAHINAGPVRLYFKMGSWQELKTTLAGRVDFAEFSGYVRQLVHEEKARLPFDLIVGNGLAGVRTMWDKKTGYNRSLT